MKLLRLMIGSALVVAAMALALAALPATQPTRLAARTGPPLQSAKIWGYQLQSARAELIAPEIDLLVIDHARDSGTTLLSARDVDGFRTRAGKPARIVLAYLSIGEAETYRYYWSKAWVSKAYLGLSRPGWLARENKDWKGNHLVRFWDADWQKLIFNPTPSRLDALRHSWFGAPRPYIDLLLEAGFDGVYLDRVDVFGEWEKTRPTAEADMAAFVAQLSAYAKARKPGFLIVPQNGEELAARENYRRSIDGIAKEDLLFGVETAERPNDRDETKRSIELLRKVQTDGKPVFVVEYLTDVKKRAAARVRMSELGFTVTFAARELNNPPEPLPPPAPPPVVPAPPPQAPITAKPAIPRPQP